MMRVPVNEPVISDGAKRNAERALASGWLSSSGPFVKEFEDAFARYLGKKHAVTTTSGTSALHLSLLALGINRGDEVLVPAFTMGAVWMSVLHTGARPIFVDCEPEHFNIDPRLIEQKIGKKTKAIIVVHTYGHSADMDRVLAIANAHKLPVIEDAAEAHGALYKGKLCGSMGKLAAFSFYANKLITTGEGGMVVTDDGKIADKVRALKNLCHSPKKRFIHDGVGFNCRMTNLQAAVGLGELAHINEYVAKKRSMASHYSSKLKGVPGLRLPYEEPGCTSVFWMYGVLVDEKKFGMDKDALRAKLASKGIDTRDFFYPPSAHPALKDIVRGGHFPITERISKTGLYLPSGLALTEKQAECVASAIRSLARSS